MVVRVGLWLTVLAFGCGDDPVGVDAGSDAGVDGGSDAGTDAGDALPGEAFVETPVGDPARATIGAAGGTITSADGRLTLVFPAGALTADTEIVIQELEYPGGRGWRLEPEGLMPAMPIQATLTLDEAEAGMPIRGTDGMDDFLELPVPYVVHDPRGDQPFTELEITPSWREADGEIDYAFALPHFSVVVYLSAGGQRLSARPTIPLFSPFRIEARQTSPPAPVSLVFRCGETRRTARFEVRWGVGVMTWEGNQEVYCSSSSAFEDGSAHSVCECQSIGRDSFTVSAPLEPLLADGRQPYLEGCEFDEERLRTRREVTVDCAGRICTQTDPVDMSTTPAGDPSVDIVCVMTGIDGIGRPWVRVMFEGPWRPSPTYYSWFSRIQLLGTDSVIAAHTIEHHDGMDEIIVMGTAPEITRDEPMSYYLIYPRELAGMITMVGVDSGIQKLPPTAGVFVPDMVPSFAFDRTVREP